MAIAWFWMLDYAYVVRRQLLEWLRPGRRQHVVNGTGEPILVIPGVYETWQFLNPVITALAELGRPIHVVTELRRNRATIVDAAGIVARYLRENDLHGVTIVAHSKGGLIGKQLMVEPDDGSRIRAMVTIGTPFSGSVYARYAVSPVIRAFSPRHPSTLRLAANLVANARITSIYSAFDPHIPGGCELDGATNIRLPIIGHFRILSDPTLLATVSAAVAAPAGEPAGAR